FGILSLHMAIHLKCVLLVIFLFTSFGIISTSVIHYSIPEELKEGSVVANLATDLSLDVTTLTKRKMRLDIIANKKYLDVNKETGEVDREQQCAKMVPSWRLRVDSAPSRH
uniref:Si:ch73-379j16.2 n=1 Tax=Salarias fasciatus TaxID=181472 RepID=A0A672FK28_SALFA